MHKHTRIIIIITLFIPLIISYWFHGNSYTQLKPIQVSDSKMIIIPFTHNMINNFPAVFKYYRIPYKVNDSGLFMIPVKYARDRDLVFTMTNCALDTTKMKMIRAKQ